HTRLVSDWSSDVCSSDLGDFGPRRLAPRQLVDLPEHRLEVAALLGVRQPGVVWPCAGNAQDLQLAASLPGRPADAVEEVVLADRSEERRVGEQRMAGWWR